MKGREAKTMRSSSFNVGSNEAGLRGLRERRSLVPEATFCSEHGWSAVALRKACFETRVFSVEMQGKLYFPTFFLDERYDRRQLESVCKVLGDLVGGSKLQFFATPKGSLGGRTALEALASGDVALVRRAAQGFVER